MLSEGGTVGVFQLEGAGMTRHLRELRPTVVDDLIAMVALYRPGPMEQIPKYIAGKNRPEEVTYLHPIMEPILRDTYGVIVYQEQVLEILQKMAAYTLGRADIVRKAIGKKKRDLMEHEEPRFVQGCLANGLSREQARTLWELMQPFAGYSFNKAHATCYGLLAYQTAYLKAHYPTEYMAALLTTYANNTDKVALSVAECWRMGVAVLAPDIDRSEEGFTVEALAKTPPGVRHERAVRFGLGAVKNVGSGPVQAILKARQEGGQFCGLDDFCERVDYRQINSRVMESLIKAGAMDSLPGRREQLLSDLPRAMAAGQQAQRAREVGQISMFDLLGEEPASSASHQLPDVPPQPRRTILGWEKELLGVYITDHPLHEVLRRFSREEQDGLTSLGLISEDMVGQEVRVLGLLVRVRQLLTKDGKGMAVVELEDMDGGMEMVVFPRTYEQTLPCWSQDNIVLVEGRVDLRNERLQLVCSTARLIEDTSLDTGAAPVEREFIPYEEDLALQPPRAAVLPYEEFPAEEEEEEIPPASLPLAVRAEVQVPVARSLAAPARIPRRMPPPRPVRGDGQQILVSLPYSDNLEEDIERMQRLHAIFKAHPGEDRVILLVRNGLVVTRLEPLEHVAYSDELCRQIENLLGEGSIRLREAEQ